MQEACTWRTRLSPIFDHLMLSYHSLFGRFGRHRPTDRPKHELLYSRRLLYLDSAVLLTSRLGSTS